MAELKTESNFISNRFQPAKSTLLVDRLMNRFIKIGGGLVIAAVMGIFIFILCQLLPLFQQAKVSPIKTFPVPDKEIVALGTDEWAELPFLLDKKGVFYFVDLAGDRGVTSVTPSFQEEKKKSSFKYRPQSQTVIFGTEDGYLSQAKIKYTPAFINGRRVVQQKITTSPFFPLVEKGGVVVAVDYADAESEKMGAGIVLRRGQKEVYAVLLTQKRSLIGKGKVKIAETYELTDQIEGEPKDVLLNSQANNLIIATSKKIYYFYRNEDELFLKQTFEPFQDLPNETIASIDYLLGDVSLVLTGFSGANRVFSLFIPKGKTTRLFGQTKEFPSIPLGANLYSKSLRNKAFLLGEKNFVSLRYVTTEKIRWQAELDFDLKQLVLNGKYNRILFLDQANQLHLYSLKDPHPETSFKALFGKLWYEGYSKPEYLWQSTGGTDDFEPKLSMVPLIVGTLKGTLYALVFAIPIALLAAIYTSQFVIREHRQVIKPAMEIMASLPSVVLGFLAALWLAPLIETRVPSLFLIVLMIPASAILFGWWWSSQSIQLRSKVKPGTEFLVFLPILIVVTYVGWVLGPVLEKALFVVTDPGTGQSVADFRMWWPEITGTPFEQRNSLVVGFMMGFAVIPILFTIAEDAFSNVPIALSSASLACGASRWQTAIRVVLPTASAGIFSAIMIGLGRAVGETMIVVMATGNTPIMDLNIFTGMRTLSANIAVELPEAPHHGTLYRGLFLGAMVLFLMTFFVNTLAEILRQYLRQKFKTA